MTIQTSLHYTYTPFYKKLYFQVIVGILLGIVIGHLSPDIGKSLKPLGDGFINLVKMIIAPIIFLTVAHGIGAMTDAGKLKNVGTKALIYFLILSTMALILGMVVANIVQPGAGFDVDPKTLDSSSVAVYQKAGDNQTGIATHLLHIIPKTFLSAFTEGEVIQVLFVAIITGLALMKIGKPASGIIHGMHSLLNVVFKIVSMFMKLAPIGAFGAMAYTIGEHGFVALKNLAVLVATFYATSLIFVIAVLWPICIYNKIPMFAYLKYIKDEILLVLGTSSSEPALPSLMRKLEKAGVSEASVGLILPIGYSFNLSGINIYMTLAALFIAQACNVDLTFEQQLTVLMVAVISSKGAAGVTGAGFIILASTLSTVGTMGIDIPVAGMALILGVDRFMSECRAITSFIGNAITAVVVAKSANELDYDKFIAVIHSNSDNIDDDGNHGNNVSKTDYYNNTDTHFQTEQKCVLV
jgi:aerobic C4-dicarboxylate transport protein